MSELKRYESKEIDGCGGQSYYLTAPIDALLAERDETIAELESCLNQHTPQNDLDVTPYSELAVDLARRDKTIKAQREEIEKLRAEIQAMDERDAGPSQ